MAVQIQLRHDTAANWTAADPTMAIGEAGYETDTGKLKLGDGATAWTSLGYFSAAAVGGIPQSLIDAKGDLIAGTADNTAGRLAVGANETVLMADNAEATGLKWSDSMKDSGPGFGTLTRTYTANADFSTAREVTAAPAGGQKIYAVDIVISGATAALWTVQMETTNNVLAAAYLPDNGTVALTLRGLIVGDADDKKLLVKSSVASAGAVTAVYYSGD